MSASIVVFDKDKDETEFGLYNRACVFSLDCAESFDSVAKSDALCILMHVTPDDWKVLCERISEKQTAFFISSAGFPPTRPEGKHRNCFRVNRPTKGVGAISHDEFKNFIELLKRGDVLQSLRNETIPPALRPYISFHQPHVARALHIYLQARLARWAGDPTHPNCAEAKKLLGLGDSIPSLSQEIDWQRLLRSVLSGAPPQADLTSPDTLRGHALRCLRREIGKKEDFGESPVKEIGEFLQAALSPGADEASIFAPAKDAWNQLSIILRLRREEVS